MHGWDGTDTAEGEYENEAAIAKVFAPFCTLLQVNIHHRIFDPDSTPLEIGEMGTISLGVRREGPTLYVRVIDARKLPNKVVNPVALLGCTIGCSRQHIAHLYAHVQLYVHIRLKPPIWGVC